MERRVAEDIIYFGLGIALAVLFARFDAVSLLLDIVQSPLVASFFAGIFFTSLFTIAPATVILVELSTTAHPVAVAACGALGALVGDMILFLFVRDRLSADIVAFVKAGFRKTHFHALHFKMFRWVFPLLGAFIIASPLPDELGIMLLGFAHMKVQHVVPISLLMNFIGVLLVIAGGQFIAR